MSLLRRIDSWMGRRIAWLVACSLIVGILFDEPLAGLVIGGVLMPEGTLYGLGLTIQLCSPTAVSSMIWAAMNGGNPHLCLTLVLIDALMIPLVMPVSLRLLTGTVVSVDVWPMMKNLLVMVAIPALIAMTAHYVLQENTTKQAKAALAPFAKLAMIVLLTGNATKCAPFLCSAAADMPRILLAVLVTCVLGYVWGYLLGRILRLDYATVVTMTLNTGMRNNAVGSTLASAYFPAEAVFPAVIVPLFSQMTAAFMMKYVRRKALAEQKRD